jgi:hypothetical protein
MLPVWAVDCFQERAGGGREKSMRLEGCIKLLLRVASNTSMAMVDLDAKYLQPACSFLSLFVVDLYLYCRVVVNLIFGWLGINSGRIRSSLYVR